MPIRNPDQCAENASKSQTDVGAADALRHDEGGDAIVPLGAHLAYIRALLGERPELDRYVRATQGCPAAGWPDEYVVAVGQLASDRLDALGISWGPVTETSLKVAEGRLEAEVVPRRHR